MPSIEPRKDAAGAISYRVKVRIKGQPPQTATFKRKTDARQWAQKTEVLARSDQRFPEAQAKRHTVAAMIEQYIRDILPNKPRNNRNQETQLQWWQAKIGRHTLAEIRPPHVALARDALAQENIGTTDKPRRRSPATVNRYLAALSHAFTIAIKEWQWLPDNPVLKISKLKEPRGRVRVLSTDERTKLLTACQASPSSHLYTYVVLAMSTGMRLGEISSLRKKQVDLEKLRLILENTKNGDRRAVALAGPAHRLVEARIAHLQPDDLLFPGGQAGKPLEIRKAWTTARKKAGVADFRFHDLRHCAASYMLEDGASIGQLMEVLGHRTPAMAKRYAHLSEGHAAQIVRTTTERIFGEQS